MTEEEWRKCCEPDQMLRWMQVRGLVSHRKLRLLLCSCCWHHWSLFRHGPHGEVVEAAERLADGQLPNKEARRIRTAAENSLQESMGWRKEDVGLLLDTFEGFHFEESRNVLEMTAALAAARAVADPFSYRQLRQTLDLLAGTLPSTRKDNKSQKCRLWQCGRVREVFGPLQFRHVRVDAACLTWNSSLVRRLAEEAYEHRQLPEGTLDSVRLAVLADALEEAGGDAEMVGHLREHASVHVRGCWVVDLLLNKA